ncbi:hypothetical protein Tco_1255921 [Tanacetum coccineum]
MLSSDSSDNRKGSSKASVPIFEGPLVQGLLDWYGYNTIEEYLSWNYFPSTDKDITDKDITDEDCIYESNYAMSKGKYVPVLQKHNPKVKIPIPVTGCVLGLVNVNTCDEIVNKIGVRKSEIYADKAKRKRKLAVAASICLAVAFAASICRLHLQQAFALAFATWHLQLAFASFICRLHLQQAFATCICILHLQVAFASKHLHLHLHLQVAFASCICRLHLQQAFALAFASKHLYLQHLLCFAASYYNKHLQQALSTSI